MQESPELIERKIQAAERRLAHWRGLWYGKVMIEFWEKRLMELLEEQKALDPK